MTPGRRTSRRRNLPAVAVLCSGSGTNLQALINATKAGRVRARLAVVIADRPDAYALTRARRAGIPACFIDPQAFASRAHFERALLRLLTSSHVRFVCLAGFMRILSPAFVRRFSNRLLNIHPALLPAFPGAHAIRDALAWGATVTGATVHLVDARVDHGPIVLQEALAVQAGESEPHLLTRVHRIEHRLYPKALQLLVEGRLRVRGRRVIIR